MAFNLSANDAIADEIGKRAMMRELAGNFNMQIDPTKFKQNQKLQKIRNLMEGTTSPGEAGNARKKLGPELFPRVETMGGMELAQGAMGGMNPLQRAFEMGRENFGSLYRRTDSEYFGGNLPGGANPKTFVDTIPQAPSGPGFYNMPGAVGSPNDDGFIGPRSLYEMRQRGLEEIRMEDEMKRRYSSDPTLAQGLPSMNGMPMRMI